MNMKKACCQCGADGKNLFGYTICDVCKSSLGLFTDETIKKHISLYDNSDKNHSYEEEIRDRFIILEKDYIKKRIKLFHIQERLKHVE